jgi:hypothetical protein
VFMFSKAHVSFEYAGDEDQHFRQIVVVFVKDKLMQRLGQFLQVLFDEFLSILAFIYNVMMHFLPKLIKVLLLKKYPQLRNFNILFFGLKPQKEDLLNQFINQNKFRFKLIKTLIQDLVNVNWKISYKALEYLHVCLYDIHLG